MVGPDCVLEDQLCLELKAVVLLIEGRSKVSVTAMVDGKV